MPKKDKTRAETRESHINFWIPDQLMEKVKIYAAKSKKTIKQIGNEALESYIRDR